MKPLVPEVTVNGEVISAEAIAAEVQNHPAPKGKPGLAWKGAARALVLRALILQAARRDGLTADPQEVGADKFETDEEALIRAYMEAAIDPDEITEADCSAYYSDPEHAVYAPNLYMPAHILIAARPEDKAARAEAKAKAEAIFEAVKAQPENIGRIAKTASDCPSKDDGGMLGQIGEGDTVPEFEAALKDIPAGALYPEPLETRYGFHIIYMHERADGAVLPFKAALPNLRLALEKRAWVVASRKFAEELLAAATVTGLDWAKVNGQAA